MAIIVSDTSPIRALHFLGRVDWLATIFDEVYIPPAVVKELAQPAARYLPINANLYPFLLVRPPPNSPRLIQLQEELEEGEAEALALAEDLRADTVLIDEMQGRKVAQEMGLFVIGTVGILLQAKKKSLCPKIAPLLDRLTKELGFFLSVKLRAQALKVAGE
jgi:uncharacterized protein